VAFDGKEQECVIGHKMKFNEGKCGVEQVLSNEDL